MGKKIEERQIKKRQALCGVESDEADRKTREQKSLVKDPGGNLTGLADRLGSHVVSVTLGSVYYNCVTRSSQIPRQRTCLLPLNGIHRLV